MSAYFVVWGFYLIVQWSVNKFIVYYNYFGFLNLNYYVLHLQVTIIIMRSYYLHMRSLLCASFDSKYTYSRLIRDLIALGNICLNQIITAIGLFFWIQIAVTIIPALPAISRSPCPHWYSYMCSRCPFKQYGQHSCHDLSLRFRRSALSNSHG